MTSLADTHQKQYSAKTAASILHLSARSLVFKLISKITHGQLTVIDGGEKFTFGTGRHPAATVTIHNRSFYQRVLFGGSIGAGETYVEGLWDTDELTELMRILVLNMDVLDRIDSGMAWLTWPVQRIRHLFNKNSLRGSKKNISAHYDLGNTLYRSFLDPTMMYSSAIYPSRSSTLEEASTFKLDHICRTLDLKPEDHVIEIGSGWGGFAIHAAQNYGCRVTTTTISEEQYAEARQRIDKAGLTQKITLLNKDYRELEGQYDKLVSIEMIEAVGAEHFEEYFKKCNTLLKADGLMLIQAITIADQKFDSYVRNVDFIQRHIFPGGCLPSNSKMFEALKNSTDFVVRNLEDFGRHYARTLEDWRHRFLNAFPSLKEHGYDERFKRLWEFYLCYCEGGFLERSISVVHLTASRPQHRSDLSFQ